MEKCHSLSKQIAIVLFLCLCTIANAQDFKIQHVQDGVGNSGGTNTGFTAVASINNAVALANNNRKVSAGLNSEADTPACQGDDISGARQLTATNTLTYYRESGSLSDNMRFNKKLKGKKEAHSYPVGEIVHYGFFSTFPGVAQINWRCINHPLHGSARLRF